MTSTSKVEARSTAVLLATLTALAVVLALFPGSASAQVVGDDTDGDTTVGTPTDVGVDRFAGRERVATSAEIALETFDQADTAIIAAAERFPDALTGNFPAGVNDAPVLLVRDNVQEEVADALEALGVENIIILGGTAAVPAAVETELDVDYDVTRIEGTTRYETAGEIATSVESEGSTAFLTTGERFPDALAAGQAAFSEEFPILLTQRDTLHPAARAAIDELDLDRIIILGGENAVSAEIEADLADEGITVDRVFGANRFSTAVEFARFVEMEFGYTAEHINIASGEDRGDGADALAMGPHAGTERNPLILTPGNEDNLDNTAHAAVDQYLRDTACQSVFLHIAGGEAAVSQSNEQALVEAANDCRIEGVELDPETTTAGSEVRATFTGPAVDDVDTIEIAGDCVEDGVIFDADEDAETGLNLEAETITATFQVNDDADLGACELTFTITFDDGRFVTVRENLDIIDEADAAAVTFDVDDGTDVAQGGVIVATARQDIAAATVDGTCVGEDLEAVIGEDDTFDITVLESADEGACEITVTVTTDDGDVLEPVTLSINVVTAGV
jgi:putative cell wall-binding protein